MISNAQAMAQSQAQAQQLQHQPQTQAAPTQQQPPSQMAMLNSLGFNPHPHQAAASFGGGVMVGGGAGPSGQTFRRSDGRILTAEEVAMIQQHAPAQHLQQQQLGRPMMGRGQVGVSGWNAAPRLQNASQPPT